MACYIAGIYIKKENSSGDAPFQALLKAIKKASYGHIRTKAPVIPHLQTVRYVFDDTDDELCASIPPSIPAVIEETDGWELL